jgi:bifunctional non-homologous end joining protein LigD
LAKKPPSGPGWIHEIKHDGFRIMGRRDAAGPRLITRNGHDFSERFPFITMAIGGLSANSCLIDGEAIVTDKRGLANFKLMRSQRINAEAVLVAFDLLELNGEDLRTQWRGPAWPADRKAQARTITGPEKGVEQDRFQRALRGRGFSGF